MSDEELFEGAAGTSACDEGSCDGAVSDSLGSLFENRKTAVRENVRLGIGRFSRRPEREQGYQINSFVSYRSIVIASFLPNPS